MKFSTGLILLLLSLSISAFELRVKKMLKDGDLDRSFVLATQIEEKVVLDCQSFVQGLRIGEYESAVFFLMDPFACEDLQSRIKSSNRRFQKHCIDIVEDIRADYTCH
jgi:hypothetical protein